MKGGVSRGRLIGALTTTTTTVASLRRAVRPDGVGLSIITLSSCASLLVHQRLQSTVMSGGQALSASSDNGFERYSEIDNSNEKRIQAIKMLGMDKDEWIATEKVHGANFGIYSMDFGKSTRYSKRSGIMQPNEHFFGYHVLIPEFQKQIPLIRQYVTEFVVKENPHTIIVNGELFGGKYSHPNVPKSKQTFLLNGKPKSILGVQTDSFPQYSPNLHFYAFDIKYRLAPEEEVITLTFDEATSVFERIPGLLYAKPIIRGTLDKVTAFDVETFETTIPPLIGMGNFPLKGNWSEGLVVKHSKRGKPGFDAKGPTIIKIKCVAFQEISTDRRQGPRVDAMEAVRKASIAKAGHQLPEMSTVVQDKALLEAALLLLDHVTLNRLKNVVSKLGTEPFTSESLTPASLADLVAQDALKDFLKEADDSTIVQTSIATRRALSKYLLFECRLLVNAEWKRIVAEKKDEEEQTLQSNSGGGSNNVSSATAAAS
jgi:RNA-editing ligase